MEPVLRRYVRLWELDEWDPKKQRARYDICQLADLHEMMAEDAENQRRLQPKGK